MRVKPKAAPSIEEIQDQVELALMRSGEHEVARACVLYREKRTQERRAAQAKTAKRNQGSILHVVRRRRANHRPAAPAQTIKSLVRGLHGAADADLILKATLKDLDGVSAKGCASASCWPPVVHRERPGLQLRHPRVCCSTQSALKSSVKRPRRPIWPPKYGEYFPKFIKHGIKIGLLNPELASFDLQRGWAKRWIAARLQSSASSVCKLTAAS